MNQEKKKILTMIEEGKINACEGMELLQALEESAPKAKQVSLRNRFLRVRVWTAHMTKVNMKIPLVLLKAASKFTALGLNLIPEEAKKEMAKSGIDLSQIDFGELLKAIEQGLVEEKLVDLDVVDPVEGPVRVEAYIE